MTDPLPEALLASTGVMQSGDFAILYRYQRWHLIKVRNGRLRILHFMTEEQARKMIETWRSKGSMRTLKEISDRFENDVEARVLETPDDYLSFLDSNEAEILGFDASIQYPEHITDVKADFLNKVTRMMETGRSGLYLCFSD